MTLTGLCVWRSAIRACRTPGVLSRGQGTYTQGQSPEPRIREYFYYLDHQGQLFLDDTKVKNFVTCFKDQQFLVFFFKHLKVNSLLMHPDSGRVYHPAPQLLGGVGLVRSALAMEFSPHFEYSSGQDSSQPPTHFLWDGQRYTLTNELLKHFAVK